MKLLFLMFKNLRRNLVRTILTSLGTAVLVFVLTAIWSVLVFIDRATTEQSKDLKSIVTDKWRIPSQMPYSYSTELSHGAARNPGDVEPADNMSWGFFGGTPTPDKMDFRTGVFGFVLEPKKLYTMMDDLDKMPADSKEGREIREAAGKMEKNIQGIILGRTRAQMIDKKIGDRFTLYGINYRDLKMEFEVVGLFPPGRYDQSAAINREYLNRTFDDYKAKNKKEHPLANATLNLYWMRHNDRDNFEQVASQVMSSPSFQSPAVKCETASSGVASFIDSYKDLLNGVKYYLTPAILATLSLIIANAISISVRERRQEIAVMKVLGFRPGQILTLILGESLILGVGTGMVTAVATWYAVNAAGGIPFPIAFLPKFFVPIDALWWGPAMGFATSFFGSVFPAVGAQSVRVTEVFSKVA